MVNASRARRDQASNSLCDGVILDALILLLQTKGTFYQAIAEHKITSSSREVHDDIFVSLTGQRCNRFWR